jgi:hypothetical protein
MRNRANATGGRKWLVTLQVDDDPRVIPSAKAGQFSQAIRSRSVVTSSQCNIDIAALQCFDDSLVVRRNHDFCSTSLQGAPGHMQDHRFAGEKPQRLAGKTLRSMAGRYGYDEVDLGFHGLILAERIALRRMVLT